jgi:uncharacterized membrane protein (DUF373 family)
MAREAGYPLKSPRGRPHNFVARVFDYIEDAIYIIVAALLVVAGIFVLGNAVATLVHDISNGTNLTTLVINVLDSGLLLFIIAELLHTVRATIQERTLVVEPFLIVGLIAGVRRLLVLTAQYAAQNTNSASGPPTDQFTWAHQGIELTVLLGLILGMTIALVLYHRYHGPGTLEDES